MKTFKHSMFYLICILLVSGLWLENVFAENTKPRAYGPKSPVYSAVLDFETGWLEQTNPNGVWSYGWSYGLTAPITLFTDAIIPEIDNGLHQLWYDPNNGFGLAPSVGRNSGGDYDDGNVLWAAGHLGLHHGQGGAYAHVIFTAPSVGVYAIIATFYAQQYGIDADVHVLVNGKVHFSNTITSLPQSCSFVQLVALRAGQKVNFSSGPNGSNELHAGWTGLEAVVTKLHGPSNSQNIRVQNPINGHWYQRFDKTMTWHDAKAYCVNSGGYLATITSQSENDFVYNILAALSPHEMVWLGATDETQEGIWEWITGESWSFTNWDSGEPNNCSGIEHYLVYFTPNDPQGRAGLWNDLGEGNNGGCGCGGCEERGFQMSTICEWDKIKGKGHLNYIKESKKGK